jgi:hypothetical protein
MERVLQPRPFFGIGLVLLCAVSCQKPPTVASVNRAVFANGASITLLAGYELRGGTGIDSYVGTISKPGAVIVVYDIGGMAGTYTECKKPCWTDGELWRKRKKIASGGTLVYVYTAKHRLICTVLESKANFYATVSSEQDIADMLEMVSSFAPPIRTGNWPLTAGN